VHKKILHFSSNVDMLFVSIRTTWNSSS